MQTNKKIKINMYYEDRTYEETTTIAKYSFQMSKIRDQSRSLFFLMKTLKYIIHVLFFKRILYCTHILYYIYDLHYTVCLISLWTLLTLLSLVEVSALFEHTLLTCRIIIVYADCRAIYTLYVLYTLRPYYNICNASRVEIIELVLENEF